MIAVVVCAGYIISLVHHNPAILPGLVQSSWIDATKRANCIRDMHAAKTIEQLSGEMCWSWIRDNLFVISIAIQAQSIFYEFFTRSLNNSNGAQHKQLYAFKATDLFYEAPNSCLGLQGRLMRFVDMAIVREPG